MTSIFIQVLLLLAQLYTYRPNADGFTTDGTIGAGASHYAAVNEVTQDGDGTYVYAPAGGGTKTELFAIQGNQIQYNAEIISVTVYCTAKATGTFGTVGTFAPMVRTNSTNYTAMTTNLTTSYVEVSNQWLSNPNTGVAWTKYELDDLEVGVSISAGSLDDNRCTQVYVVVEYEPQSDAIIFGGGKK